MGRILARALAACLGLLLLSACGGPAGGPTTQGKATPEFLNLDPAVEYVGMEQCRSCHLGIYTTYAETGMGRAFYPLTADEIVEDFTENNEFVDANTGLHYRMFERDGKYFQRQFLLDEEGQEIAAEERELRYVVGSNNHSRSYVTLIGDKWFQAPACWYPQGERWDVCPGFEHKNEHFAREISESCIHCHNGRMELIEGERNEFHKPYPHGIGCERCHGPGQLHVERWSRPDAKPKGELDPTIVNPLRLPTGERIDICFQCHLGDSKATERVARYGRELKSFRPGQRITEVVVPFHFEQATEVDFGLSAQSDRLIRSACFTESDGRLDCLTCHNPHVTVYHAQRPDDFFRRKCLGCHNLDACAAPMETRRETEPQDDCVACHMRRAEPDDQRFTEFTDHWIRREIDFDERDHRERFEIVPVFPEDLARFPEAEQAYYRARAYFLMSEKVPKQSYRWMWGNAERYFREAIDKGFDTEEAWFFLGKTLTYKKETAQAAEAYQKALERAPDHMDAAFALGQALVSMGQLDRALAVFRGMLERDPENAMALAEYARTLWQGRRFAEALEAYERALEQEPWSWNLHLNRGMTLAALGRFDEAAEEGVRATSLNPDSVGPWQLYANAMREAGRMEQAREGQRQLERLQQRKSTGASE